MSDHTPKEIDNLMEDVANACGIVLREVKKSLEANDEKTFRMITVPFKYRYVAVTIELKECLS